MKRIALLFVFCTTFSFAQTQLSRFAKISVITLGPWQGELYSAFGHSAFRVRDPERNIDLAYNYGVFDFNQPNFYLNFARGYLNYKLGVYPYPDFEYHYIYQNRYIHQQILNLDSAQTQQLFDFLQWNSRSENQSYRYDYFYNNCATKIPDVVKRVFKDSVQFDGSHIKTDYTIRELTDLYLEYQPWGDLGIDIGLGMPIDKKATPYQYMFLPDYVEQGFANATIKRGNETVPLVKQRISIFEPDKEKFSKGLPPVYVFSAFFLLAAWITYRDFKRRALHTWFDAVLFAVVGIVGLLLLFLWVATDHHASAKNLNLLWALPTHVIAAVALIKKPTWLRSYFIAVAILSVLLILFWFFLPQKLHYALIPIVMTIALRSWAQYKLKA
jgi:hypothetical protein